MITFKKLVFDGIQQEVVLLLGERNGNLHTGIRTVELNSIEELQSYQYTEFLKRELKPLDHSTEKWTQYFLDRREIELLRELRANPKLARTGDFIDVDVGIVTGQNAFFVLNREQIRAFKLENYTQKIVSRSGHLQGLNFTDRDWSTNAQNELPSFLFSPPDASLDDLPISIKNYILNGQELGYHNGYKCSIRKRWYIVPSVWTPSAFMLRQIHAYPKIIFNETEATCTDTIHRIRFLNGTNGKVIAATFMNSLTFAFAEVIGRSYGGGVLELEPKEAEELPIVDP